MGFEKHSKGYLFCDIDGVIIGNYGNDWQIRPYTKTFLDWVSKKLNFDIIWISANSDAKRIVDFLDLPGRFTPPVANDRRLGLGKLDKIYDTLSGDIENQLWFMIEDEEPNEEIIKALKLNNSLHKWMVVPDSGADVLLDLHLAFAEWRTDIIVLEKDPLKTFLNVPYEWCCRTVPNKDMCCRGEWKGYGESERKQ